MNPEILNRVEKDFDRMLDLWVTHPYFLKSINLALRLNVYRKLFVKKSLQNLWKSLELPNQKDQMKTMAMMQELEMRLFDLEKKLTDSQNENTHLKSKLKTQTNKFTHPVNHNHTHAHPIQSTPLSTSAVAVTIESESHLNPTSPILDSQILDSQKKNKSSTKTNPISA